MFGTKIKFHRTHDNQCFLHFGDKSLIIQFKPLDAGDNLIGDVQITGEIVKLEQYRKSVFITLGVNNKTPNSSSANDKSLDK